MMEKELQAVFGINHDFGIYKGDLYENIIAEALAKSENRRFYYRKANSTLEMDFFLRTGTVLSL